MKSIITLVAIAIMASPSFAATTKKTTTTKTTTKTTESHSASASVPSSTYSSHRSVANDGLNWQAGLGIGTFASTFTLGARVQGMVPVSRMDSGDILVGGETGFLYGTSTPSAWVIPIMAAGQFNFKGNGKITPYTGLAMGVGVAHVNSATVGIAGIATVTTTSSTSAYFALLAKGGLYFGEEQKLFAELPLGVFASTFTIIPTFGMRF